MDKITAKDLIDSGVFPACYDREHNHALYGDNSDKILFENHPAEMELWKQVEF